MLDAIIPSTKYFFQPALLYDSHTSYVCMYMCLCMYLCMYAFVYVCVYVCMHACMHVFMYVCMHVDLYVCVYVCVCMWQRTSPNLQRGDLVLLRENSTTPLYWPTAVITDIHPRVNSIVCEVTRKNSKGISNVSLEKFCLFPHVNSE